MDSVVFLSKNTRIHDNLGNYQQAIEDYKKAIAYGSTEAKEILRELEQYLKDNEK